MIEDMLKDISKDDSSFNIAIFIYITMVLYNLLKKWIWLSNYGVICITKYKKLKYMCIKISIIVND